MNSFEKICALKSEGKSWPQIAAEVGMSKEATRSFYRRECARGDKPQVARGVKRQPVEVVFDGPTDELVGDRVLTLEDLLAVSQVDLTKWDVERFVVNKWEVGAKIAEEELRGLGDNLKWVTTERIVTTPLWQVKAWFKAKPRVIERMAELKAGLIEEIKQSRVSVMHPLIYPTEAAPYLFEYSPFDLHLGKLVWGEETTGASYDVKIAADLFYASLKFLHTKAKRCAGGDVDRILCVFGNDAMHVDSKKGDTTAGTHMDFDSRYIKVYRRLVQIHRDAINILRQTAPVDVVMVPGNHDELTTFHLGEVLDAAFAGVPDVTVDNSARMRKYYSYGVNLFGFTHGDAEKVSELPLAMAREVPELWARCPSREWHIGHLHKSEKWEDVRKPQMVQDFYSDKGIRIRRLTSISGHDAWHTKHAYMDRRAVESFLFHKEAGFTDHLSFNVDHFTGKALSV